MTTQKKRCRLIVDILQILAPLAVVYAVICGAAYLAQESLLYPMAGPENQGVPVG
jgi:hypothetical protein